VAVTRNSQEAGSGRITIPSALGDWRCTPVAPERQFGQEPAELDSSWSGICAATSRHSLEIFIGYAGTQSSAKRLKSPALTFPGAIIQSDVVSVESSTRVVHARRLIGQRSDGSREAVLYWYQLGEESLNGEYGLRWALLVRRLLNRSTSGLIVRISTRMTRDESHKAFAIEHDLASHFVPIVAQLFKAAEGHS